MKFIKPFYEGNVPNPFKFEWKDIRYYFDELLDNGWQVTIKSAVGLKKMSKPYTGYQRLHFGDYFKVRGFKMGVFIRKKKDYRSETHLSFETDNDPVHIMSEKDYNFGDEIDDLIELSDRLEEIKDRMTEDGFFVTYTKSDRDDSIPLGRDQSVVGAYVSVVKYEEVKKLTESAEDMARINQYKGKFKQFDFDFIYDCLQELLDNGWKIENVSEPRRIEQSNPDDHINKYYSKILLNKIKNPSPQSTINLHCKDQQNRSTSSHFTDWDIEKEIQDLDNIADRFLEIKDRLEEKKYFSYFSKNSKNYNSIYLHIIK